MSTADLLIEIGTEELPPSSLKSLGESFLAASLAKLAEAGIAHVDGHWIRQFPPSGAYYHGRGKPSGRRHN